MSDQEDAGVNRLLTCNDSSEDQYQALLDEIDKGSRTLKEYVIGNLRTMRLQDLRRLAKRFGIEYSPLDSKTSLAETLYNEGLYPGSVGDKRWYRRKGGHVNHER